MKFTHNEMVFFNSITPGKDLFGFPIKLDVKDHNKDQTIQKTMEGLIAKGILKDADTLSPQGAVVAQTVDVYKNCEKHVIVNKLHIGMIDNMNCVLIYQVSAELYDICCLPKSVILYLILKQHPFLCKSNETLEHPKPDKMNLGELVKELYDKKEDVMLGVFQKNIAQKEVFYYEKDNALYCFNVKNKSRKQVEVRRVRMEIMEALEIANEEVA